LESRAIYLTLAHFYTTTIGSLFAEAKGQRKKSVSDLFACLFLQHSSFIFCKTKLLFHEEVVC